MNPSIDIRDQVYDVARVIHGGTNNDYGAAQEQLVLPFVNDSGASIALYSLVTLNRGVATTTTAGEYVLGVCVGRYNPTTGLQEAVDAGVDEMAAVCVAGRTYVIVSASVAWGAWLVASATDGQATTATSGSLAEYVFGRALLAGGTGEQTPVILDGGASSSATSALAEQYYTINFLISGGTSVPAIGALGIVKVDAPGTIVAAHLFQTGASGACQVSLEKAALAVPTPSFANMVGGNPLVLSAAVGSSNSLSGWTTTLSMGDLIKVTLDSITTITSVVVALKVRRA